tara:strand:+ start:351013 stop:351537 length:525 start_codon:yes stop_codon:yes gene_type:complete
MKPYTFETERLLIRPTDTTDAAFILMLMNTPKWLQYIGDRNVHSIVEAKDYIKNKMTSQLTRLGYSNYTVIRKSDAEKIGTCGLYDREGLEGIDLGFAFLPHFEKKGYAFESTVKLKEEAINTFNIKELNAITTQENKASQRLLEKLGFSFFELIKIPKDTAELMLYRFSTKTC